MALDGAFPGFSLACGLHGLDHCGAQLCRGVGHPDAGSLEGLDLVLCRTLTTGDDGAGVAHAAPWRSRDARDERHHRLVLAVGLDPVRRFLLGAAADLADHDDAFRLRVIGKTLQAVDEVRSVEGVAADANAGALAQAGHCRLVDRLVSQRSRPAHDANLALLVDVARHDSHLALARLDDARTVWANQARFVLAHQGMLHLHHVLLRDALRNANDEGDFGLECLQHGRGGRGWRHVDHRGIAVGLLLRLHAVGEDRQVHVRGAALLRVHTTDHLRPVVNRLRAVEGSLPSCHALADHLGVLVDPHLGGGGMAHGAGKLPRCEAAEETLHGRWHSGGRQGHGRLKLERS
mmetsp:Transcript_39579/g.73797  ORF Transcript_39579/g.73797 Transcript_39579/m.73797 type:complete len:348 (+) Transcript_39579:63-1106(+)